MRLFFGWAICSAVLVHSGSGFAQQFSPIKPNYGRSVQRVAASTLPSPSETVPIGTGIRQQVIPQQGQVNLGTPGMISRPAPAIPSLPSYSYGGAATAAPYQAAPLPQTTPVPAAPYSAPAPFSSAPITRRCGSLNGEWASSRGKSSDRPPLPVATTISSWALASSVTAPGASRPEGRGPADAASA